LSIPKRMSGRTPGSVPGPVPGSDPSYEDVSMEGSEYMYAAVEAGVALAGFSALVVALRHRDDKSLSASDRLVVASLVERGLMAAFFALLPILLFGLKISAELVWLVCSGLFFLYGISLVIRAIRSRKIVAVASDILPSPLYYALMLIGILVVILQLVHALGIGVTQSAWWYLVAVTWLLTTAGYRFFFVLRRWIRDG